MKIKIVILIIALVIPAKDYAQTAIDQTIPLKPGQSVTLHFDYPELIEVSTWDRAEISIQGEVMINGGENDDAFILEHITNGNVVSIRSEIRDIKNLPQRITINHNGREIMFKDKAAFQKYQAEHGAGGYSSMSWGPKIDIRLQVKVPRNVETDITSVYGMVEVRDFAAPLKVEATYGGVDASLVERTVGEVTAETSFGQIYSNLDATFGGDRIKEDHFYTFVSANPGKGPNYSFESKYGNVYLRKAN